MPQNPTLRDSDAVPASEDEPTETRRVQVVARWNSWVQVYDPADESLTWVDLAETAYAPA